MVGAFVGFETSARRSMVHTTGMRVFDFGDQEAVVATQDAESGLAGADLH